MATNMVLGTTKCTNGTLTITTHTPTSSSGVLTMRSTCIGFLHAVVALAFVTSCRSAEGQASDHVQSMAGTSQTIVWSKDSSEMCLVPEGKCTIGKNNGELYACPETRIAVNGFYIDKH